MLRAAQLHRVLGGIVFAVIGCCVVVAASAEGRPSVSVIYCTDLFHPHGDPDDHFDLATLFAMPELDIKGVVLDQGRKQLKQPGRIPMSQMNRITGRQVPAVIGLADALQSPGDKGLEQAAEFQGGVELILRTLRESKGRVRIATAGSVRDVMAAFNREPALFHSKVAMVLAFIGEASDPKFVEWNVSLDPQAYVGLMRSGLPLWWVPCFDGGIWQNKGHASFWRASHRALLKGAEPEVIQYFIYALEKEQAEPLGFLARPVDPERRERLFAGTRNLWCAAVLGTLSGREVVLRGGQWVSVLPPGGQSGTADAKKALFGFSEVDVMVSDSGVVSYGRGPASRKVKRFEVWDAGQYERGMTEATAGLLSELGRAGAAPAR